MEIGVRNENSTGARLSVLCALSGENTFLAERSRGRAIAFRTDFRSDRSRLIGLIETVEKPSHFRVSLSALLDAILASRKSPKSASTSNTPARRPGELPATEESC